MSAWGWCPWPGETLPTQVSIMKLNKETLLKHKFWVLLLVTLPFSLGAIFLLATSVSGDIFRERKKIEADLVKYTKALEAKTPAQIEAARKEAELINDMQKSVWEKAYKIQEPIFTWPKEVE